MNETFLVGLRVGYRTILEAVIEKFLFESHRFFGNPVFVGCSYSRAIDTRVVDQNGVIM